MEPNFDHYYGTGPDYDNRDDAFNRALGFVREDVEREFAAFQNGSKGAVAYATAHGQDTKTVQYMVEDMLGYDETTQALLKVLRESTCPTVAALRKAIVDKYMALHGEDLATDMVTA